MKDEMEEVKRNEYDLNLLLWRDMNSAPKDGSYIIGATECGDMAIVQWYDCSGHLPENGYWSLVVTGAYAEDSEWAPEKWLPAPKIS